MGALWWEPSKLPAVAGRARICSPQGCGVAGIQERGWPPVVSHLGSLRHLENQRNFPMAGPSKCQHRQPPMAPTEARPSLQPAPPPVFPVSGYGFPSQSTAACQPLPAPTWPTAQSCRFPLSYRYATSRTWSPTSSVPQHCVSGQMQYLPPGLLASTLAPYSPL